MSDSSDYEGPTAMVMTRDFKPEKLVLDLEHSESSSSEGTDSSSTSQTHSVRHGHKHSHECQHSGNHNHSEHHNHGQHSHHNHSYRGEQRVRLTADEPECQHRKRGEKKPEIVLLQRPSLLEVAGSNPLTHPKSKRNQRKKRSPPTQHESEQHLQLFLRTSKHNEPLPLLIEPSATVFELKKQIFDKTGLPIRKQVLSIPNTTINSLLNRKLISDYPLQNNNPIQLERALTGGSSCGSCSCGDCCCCCEVCGDLCCFPCCGDENDGTCCQVWAVICCWCCLECCSGMADSNLYYNNHGRRNPCCACCYCGNRFCGCCGEEKTKKKDKATPAVVGDDVTSVSL